MRYEEVEREYLPLKQQFEAGTLTEDQFRARLEELMIEDEQGRWWIIGYETGKWYYNDGEQWVAGDPPRAAAVTPVAAEDTVQTVTPPAPPLAAVEPVTQTAPAPQPTPLAPAAAAAVGKLGSTASTSAAPAAAGTVPPSAPPVQAAAQGGRRGGLFGLIGLIAVVILVGAIILIFMQRRNTTGAVPPPTQAVAAAMATTPAPVETETVAAIAEVTETPAATETEPLLTPTEAPPTPTEAPTETPVSPPATETPSPVPTDTPPPTDTLVPSTSTATPPAPTATRPKPTVALPTANPNVVADFETFGTWKIGNQKYGTLKPVSSPTHDGKVAAQLVYSFPAVNDNYVVFEARPARAIAGKPTQLSMWVYGDGSGHYLNLWIQDSQGEVQSFTLGPILHKGWQQMTANLKITGNWPQGRISQAGNDRLDYPIRLFAIVLDGIPDGVASKGEIVLDSLTVGGAGAG